MRDYFRVRGVMRINFGGLLKAIRVRVRVRGVMRINFGGLLKATVAAGEVEP